MSAENKLMFLLLVALSIPLPVKGNAITKINIEWFSTNRDYITETLESKDDKMVLPIILMLADIWSKRDGGIGAEVAPDIARAIFYHPNLMLAWFHEHDSEFNSFVESLPSTLLTDFSGEDAQQIELFRLTLIQSLDKYLSAPTTPTSFKKQANILKEKLVHTQVTEID